MADVFTKQKRRKVMQAVRRERTAPEEQVAKNLRSAGVRFRRNVRSLPGSPDFVLLDHHIALFVHGCFWHGHDRCPKGRKRPKSNQVFWNERLRSNRARDRRAARELRDSGYCVVVAWECRVRPGWLPPMVIRSTRS